VRLHPANVIETLDRSAALAAIAIATGVREDDLARVPLSFPTYTGILGRAAAISARALGRDSGKTRFADWM
jgi:hypothetical protein